MVAFLRVFLLFCSLLTTVYSFQTIKTSNERKSLHVLAVRNDLEHTQSSSTSDKAPFSMSRKGFLSSMIAAAGAVLTLPSNKASAIEGDSGGPGKTAPETGVEHFGSASQNNKGIISAEIQVNEKPVRVSFQSPWPLLVTTEGLLEARDPKTPESAFVQVVSGVSKLPADGREFRPIILQSVLSQQGKFSAYGTPTDATVRATKDPSVYSVAFTTLDSGQVETERQTLVKAVHIPADPSGSLVLLVVGTTKLRYSKQKEALQLVVDSFEAVPAPAKKSVPAPATKLAPAPATKLAPAPATKLVPAPATKLPLR